MKKIKIAGGYTYVKALKVGEEQVFPGEGNIMASSIKRTSTNNYRVFVIKRTTTTNGSSASLKRAVGKLQAEYDKKEG